MAAVFAGVAMWVGKGRTRGWAIVWLILCLIGTALQIRAAIKEHQDFIKKVERAKQLQSQDKNAVEVTNTGTR
jgi:hypothetical protein